MLTKLEIPADYAPSIWVYRRGVKWYWKYKLPNGKFHTCVVSKDEKLAKRNAKLKERQLAKGLFNDKEITKIQNVKSFKSLSKSISDAPFKSAIDGYIEAKQLEPKLSKRYVEDEEIMLKSSISFFVNLNTLDNKSIAAIRSNHIWDYRTYLLGEIKDKNLKSISASNRLNCIKRFFKWLKKRKFILVDPSFEVDRIEFTTKEASRDVILPLDAVRRINQVNFKHLYDFPIKELVNFLILTGARLGEALHCEVDDFDLKNSIWKLKYKPNCPTRYGLGWKPKRGNERLVPLSQNVVKIIEPLIERAKTEKVVGYIKGENKPVEAKFLFTMLDRKLSTSKKQFKKGKPIVKIYRRVDKVNKSWKNLFIKAGVCAPDSDGRLVVNYTRHDARRGFNHIAEVMGISLKERSAILGHEERVNKSNYQGETYLDLQSVGEKLEKFSI